MVKKNIHLTHLLPTENIVDFIYFYYFVCVCVCVCLCVHARTRVH